MPTSENNQSNQRSVYSTGLSSVNWASYSLRSPNRPPPSPAHPAIPARLAALRVGTQIEMHGFFGFLAASFCQPLTRFFLFPRDPAFRCRRTRDRTGKG